MTEVPREAVFHDSTCWELVDGAAAGVEDQRTEFARRYTPFIRTYLVARWRGSAYIGLVDDTLQEVFVECFRIAGVLQRVDDLEGSFRAFLCGAIRNVALRAERDRATGREIQVGSSFGIDERIATGEDATRVLDRAWARTLLDLAGEQLKRRARSKGEDAVRRTEILRLRFEAGIPIREIARAWGEPAERIHQEYRRARAEFLECLEGELSRHDGSDRPSRAVRWNEFLELFA